MSKKKTPPKSAKLKMCPCNLIWKKDENQLIEVKFHILLSLEQSLHQDTYFNLSQKKTCIEGIYPPFQLNSGAIKSSE